MPYRNITSPLQRDIELDVGGTDVSFIAPLPTIDPTGDETLELILLEMQKMNFHLAQITGEQVSEADLTNE